jgi:LysM repeat protein
MSTNGLRSTPHPPGQVLGSPRQHPPSPHRPRSRPRRRPPLHRRPQPPPTPHVVRGDTLSHIAARHGTTVATLMSTNGLRSTLIHPGQVLRSPQTAPAKPAPAPKPAAPTAPAPHDARSRHPHRRPRRHAVPHRRQARHHRRPPSSSTNGLRSTLIHPGQVLRLTATAPTPQSAGTAHLVPSTFLHYSYPKPRGCRERETRPRSWPWGPLARGECGASSARPRRRWVVDPSLALGDRHEGVRVQTTPPCPRQRHRHDAGDPVVRGVGLRPRGTRAELLDPRDNVTAGVAIIRQLVRTSSSLDIAIASYYQGAGSVKRNGCSRTRGPTSPACGPS